MELSLVFFTVLSQLAVGLALFSPLDAKAGQAASEISQRKKYYFVVLVTLAVALLISSLHLGHPMGAIRTLTNMGSSWLSREILFFGLFGAALFFAWLTGNAVFMWISAVVGFLAVCVAGMVYAPEAQMAVNNVLPLIFFLLTAVSLGSIAYAYIAPKHRRSLLRNICLCSLVVMLVLYLVVPCVWNSGNAVTQATAQVWLASPFYWARLGVGLFIPIYLLLQHNNTLDKAVFPLVLTGELLGRIVFFQTIHSATFIGQMY